MPKHSIIVVTYRRDDRLRATLERLSDRLSSRDDWELVLVDNNADGVDRSDFINGMPGRLVVQESNTGCTGGRNAGISAARGDILLLVDDDALIETKDPLGELDRIFGDETVAAVAFRSVDGSTGEADPKEFPHTDKTLDPTTDFDTFRFIGVGHALRADVLRKIGAFRQDYFYGMEEFELSFRLLKAGYRIRYEPVLVVRHMKDSAGRLPKVAAVERHAINKLKTAWLHLPAHLALMTLVAWTGRAVILSRGRANLLSMASELRGWIAEHRHDRRPMNRAVLHRIAGMGGSAWR